VSLAPPILNPICHCEEAAGRRGNLIKQSLIISKDPLLIWTIYPPFILADLSTAHLADEIPMPSIEYDFMLALCYYQENRGRKAGCDARAS
jgi:hypothetical protein